MKIGKTFTYTVKNGKRIIRKERDYYITYVPEEMSFFELEEFPFQIIKHTINKTIHLLAKNVSNNYGIPLKEIKRSICIIQKELIKRRMLDHALERKRK